MAMHQISQHRLPVVLVGAGLPQLVGLSGRSKSYAERLFEFPVIGPLNKLDASAAIEEPAEREGVTFSGPALTEILRVTDGYPYFLQEWGYHAWNIAKSSPISIADIEQANKIATISLDESFFRVRFDRLTPSEKKYLWAMALIGPGPHRSGEIADVMGFKVNQVGPVRSSLVKKGMIFSPQYGDTAFTVPLFDQFMMRVMPKSTVF
jgi:hypothetical protein